MCNQDRTLRGALAGGLISLLIIMVGCSADLHEDAGPLVPFPNVTGRVCRDGEPLAGFAVELEDTVADTTVETRYTDESGDYGFSGVGSGKWTVRVNSGEPLDFERATFEFTFATEDSTLDVPLVDMSRRGLALLQPLDGESRVPPTLWDRLDFEWTWPNEDHPRFEVRLRASGESTFWSEKTNETSYSWNGVGDQGTAVPPGDYSWHIRVEGEGTLEYRTETRTLTFE